MKVKLNQIATKARQDKKLKFTSLIHHVNDANLAECYQELKRNKAPGSDGQTVDAYGENLNDRLTSLIAAMRPEAISS